MECRFEKNQLNLPPQKIFFFVIMRTLDGIREKKRLLRKQLIFSRALLNKRQSPYFFSWVFDSAKWKRPRGSFLRIYPYVHRISRSAGAARV
jgi:hypothetical protein